MHGYCRVVGRALYECIEAIARLPALAPFLMPMTGDASCGDSVQQLVKEQADIMADFVAFVVGDVVEEADAEEGAAASSERRALAPCT